ncbi:sigma-70 family RNA polymerase sigma factor [uncultured Clostridium sp.]|uniref:RNA polymerase sigma factor n=1 Tax=uncultured Clostridium sp. TaxID=59620 RepID=UPI0028E79B1F|nr:sigma-70 family RNA polymerase sigma factor [uncultured Clostridium sp.]
MDNEVESLVEKAKRGDEDSFIKLIEMYKRLMYSIAKSMINNNEDIGDIIQDTIFKSYKNIKKLKDPKVFKSWLMRILINNCNDFIKKHKNIVSLEEVIEKNEICQGMEMVELRHIVNNLHKDLTMVVELYYIQDMDIKDIAELIEVPEGTVKSRLYRARKELSRALSDRSDRFERYVK